MQKINPKIRTMTVTEQVEYGLCSRGLMLEQGERIYRLTAGTTDSLYVYQQGTVTYVLTMNRHLDYLALDWYQGNEDEPVDSLFLQGAWAISECLGEGWKSCSVDELVACMISLFG